MRVPESLTALFDYGVLDEVLRPLMSGKEAQVYLVVSEGKQAVAKIYKDAKNRSFKNRAEYTEGRKVRNTRDQRAIANRSKHGREQDESAWRSTEVDMIHRLHAAGVRVPVPYHFVEGVLLMELVTDADGNPAPRLGDVPFEPDTAREMYERLMRSVVQMLCAGVVHGDLSEFNVLVGADGPVIIDFPQSVDSAHNTNARRLLVRDVENLHHFLSRFVPNARRLPYAEEMWSLHERNLLTPETRLRGEFRSQQRQVNTESLLDLIDDANRDERKRRDSLGLRGGPAEPEARAWTKPRDASAGQSQRGGPPQNRSSGPPQNRSGGPPNNRVAAPKKDAPVYQGLANEGLKFFRHVLDPQHQSSGRKGKSLVARRPEPRSQGPRPQQGQGSQGPRPQPGQGSQGPRPQQGQNSQGRPQQQGSRPQQQQGSQGPRPQQPQGSEDRPQQSSSRSQGQRPDHPPPPRPQDSRPESRSSQRFQAQAPQQDAQRPPRESRPERQPSQPQPQGRPPQSPPRNEAPRVAPREERPREERPRTEPTREPARQESRQDPRRPKRPPVEIERIRARPAADDGTPTRFTRPVATQEESSRRPTESPARETPRAPASTPEADPSATPRRRKIVRSGVTKR